MPLRHGAAAAYIGRIDTEDRMEKHPHLDRDAIERNARHLRAAELNRMAQALAVKWATFKDRLWPAPARNPLPASPVMPNG
jgi:hypothetical protein